MSHLDTVLQLLRSNRLVARSSKCSFGCTQISYLGRIILDHGVMTDPAKVKAVQEWPVPRSVKQLRGFPGLTGYYRQFVINYGHLARPLVEFLKQNSFQWNSSAQESFDRLKQAMTTAPILASPDFIKRFMIETDACGDGIGVVLMQEGHPIGYISKALSPKNQLLSVYEKEMFAILHAIK